MQNYTQTHYLKIVETVCGIIILNPESLLIFLGGGALAIVSSQLFNKSNNYITFNWCACKREQTCDTQKLCVD